MLSAGDLLKSLASLPTTGMYQYVKRRHWLGFISEGNERPPFTIGKIKGLKYSKCT